MNSIPNAFFFKQLSVPPRQHTDAQRALIEEHALIQSQAAQRRADVQRNEFARYLLSLDKEQIMDVSLERTANGSSILKSLKGQNVIQEYPDLPFAVAKPFLDSRQRKLGA